MYQDVMEVGCIVILVIHLVMEDLLVNVNDVMELEEFKNHFNAFL